MAEEEPQEERESPGSRVLLQQGAQAEVEAAVSELNRLLSQAADLGLDPRVEVHRRKRTTGFTADSDMVDISVVGGAAATPLVSVSFAGPVTPASVSAMRRR